jgi:hypothetical protein
MNTASARVVFRVVLFFAVALVPAVHVSGAVQRVTVAAGDFDRSGVPVRFQLPDGSGPASRLRAPDGRTFPVQVDPSRNASFILDRLGRGQSATFDLDTSVAEKPSGLSVAVEKSGRKWKFTVGGRPVIEYQAEPGELPRSDIPPVYARGGYLHPILTPSGRLVSDDFPSNHTHHHGIWFPWTKTEFEGRHPDFWNMGEGKGRVEFVALDSSWGGPVHGGFTARHRFVDLLAPEPKAALNERWEIRIYAVSAKDRPFWMFDMTSTQDCASASPLKLLHYYYGGLGFRGNWDWNGKDKTFFLTSDGETDRVKGNEKRGRWCHVSGDVNGQRAGIAILCHPDNFRAPQPMRLHPTEPFFCFAPAQVGEFQIEPGRSYVSRYRFIVQDGAPDRADLDRLWNDYAHPPEVTAETR